MGGKGMCGLRASSPAWPEGLRCKCLHAQHAKIALVFLLQRDPPALHIPGNNLHEMHAVPENWSCVLPRHKARQLRHQLPKGKRTGPRGAEVLYTTAIVSDRPEGLRGQRSARSTAGYSAQFLGERRPCSLQSLRTIEQANPHLVQCMAIRREFAQ